MTSAHPAVENEVRSSRSRFTKGGRRITYQLSVVQQPERARACGQGAKSTTDRRPVDPPPIVDLRIFEGEEGHLTDITFSYPANIFLFASLENARPSSNARPGQTGPNAPVLTGTPVAGISYLDRPIPAGYFIFPDLSVRHEGVYRLTFNLFEELKDQKDEDSMAQLATGTTYIHGRCEVKTAPFTVYSAKKFPGLMESTSLSRMVADQGCRVRIRRDVRMRRRETKGRDKWDDYEDETAHERAKREVSPGECPPPASTATQAPAPASNLNNGHAPYGSSNTARQADLNTPFAQQAQSQQPQQMSQATSSTYPPYMPYETTQMHQYMAQNPGFAQYPQPPAAYGYPNQPMIPYAAGYGYLSQPGMHHASMYDQMPHPPVDYGPPASTYPRQSIAAPSMYNQAQTSDGDVRQAQSSEQSYVGQMPLQNPPGSQYGSKGLPRLPNQNLAANGRVDNGLRTTQLYPDAPRASVHVNQTQPAPKRRYSAAFDNQSYEAQRLQFGSRPQTSQYSRTEQDPSVSNTNEEQSSDAESLELEQLTMTYRRADGTERTRRWPQLRS